jgi:hypothetical protein
MAGDEASVPASVVAEGEALAALGVGVEDSVADGSTFGDSVTDGSTFGL